MGCKGPCVTINARLEGSDPWDSAFIQVMMCMEPSEKGDKALVGVRMRCSTDHEVRYTLETRVGSKSIERLEVGERFGVKMFVTIVEHWIWTVPNVDLN